MQHKDEDGFDDYESSVLQPNPGDPEQYWDMMTNGCHCPEQALLLAVLEDALLCLQKHLFAESPKEKRIFRDAEEWIFDDGEDEDCFSLPGVCASLGIDPDWLRRRIRRWKVRALEGKASVISGRTGLRFRHPVGLGGHSSAPRPERKLARGAKSGVPERAGHGQEG